VTRPDTSRTARRAGARAISVLVIVAIVVIAFVVRLVDIQVVSAATYTDEAKDRRALEATVYGTRGDILDTNGQVLADSVERYDITVSPRVALGYTDMNGPVEPYLAGIASVTGQSVAELDATLRADPDSDYAVLSKGLTLDEYLAVHELGIPWVIGVRVPGRTYPNGAIAGNIVGFLGTDEPLAGIEQMMDQCLAGQDGLVSYERGADGVRLPDTEVVEVDAVDGADVTLTIDRDLQWTVMERLAAGVSMTGAEWGQAIVVRIADGAIMSLADWPTFDPNEFQTATVTGSRAFTTPYEPGSIMKPITFALLLDQRAMAPETPVDATWIQDYGEGGTLYDFGWHPADLTAAGVLAISSNTGTANLAQLIPDELRRQYMLNFGLGDVTDVHFPGESAGILGEYWDERTRLNVSFGAGIATTIMQIAGAYVGIGNDGLRLPLKLVENCTYPDGTVVEPERAEPIQVIDQYAAHTTIDLMEGVQAYYLGTGTDVDLPGYRLAVKSGTATVAEGGVYGDKSTVSYVGLAPAEDPEYIVVTSLGLPYGGTSDLAAPVMRDIMSHTLTRYRVPPSTGERTHYSLYW